MIIKVPASTANLGPGFDSIGMAVSLYLEVEILNVSDRWQVDHVMPKIPHDENNLIVKTALTVYPGMQPLHLRVKSDIPLAHGLGSSSSAVAAGIELADHFGKLGLSDEEKAQIGAQIEGHPDNIVSTILGGLVVGTEVDNHFDAVKAPLPPYSLVAYVPDYNLPTKKARGVLPKELSLKEATHGSAIANTLVASLFAQNYEMAGELMEKDVFHEPYREKLVPELLKVREVAHQKHALTTYLSGAGSTIMTWIEDEHVKGFLSGLNKHGLKANTLVLHPDEHGVQIIE
ncbi:homoserine kinase [Lactobacillus kitasatonis]|uniref:Homoserine kinase n=1 Tax=Lactobacillus kitasatonis DSM 16761 = JCM 1039 TaxID=1423767 RepID=A0A0R1VMS5_9LACO|nr:homoserine kinase [Lactobacillus kitasatonis]KRM06653.1 homoserine kinase [Lactobacillus kitasatonis DSM 16761 = JCM 1039]